jgi:anti-anti-sigma regulatory factor
VGTDVYDDGVLRISRTGLPVTLSMAGEIDESTYSGLLGALKELADGRSEVHIDLAGVTYCDLAGLRAIVSLARAGGGDNHHGRRLVLYGVPPNLRAILHVIGWDTTPGLAMNEQL